MKTGKKKLILVSLCLGLSLAVYLNWQFAGSGDISVSGLLHGGKKYGEVVLTGTDGGDTLEEVRLSRDTARAEVTESLEAMAGEEYSERLTKIAEVKEKETKVEEILKTKGIMCVVYVTDEGADITVQTENGLSGTEASVIQEAVVSECGLPPEKIVIVEVK